MISQCGYGTTRWSLMTLIFLIKKYLLIKFILKEIFVFIIFLLSFKYLDMLKNSRFPIYFRVTLHLDFNRSIFLI